jgi:microcystin-dependent protein
MYGGDGRTTFALPDLRGRTSLSFGNGSTLTPRTVGQKGGQERVTLTTQEIPSHRHSAEGSSEEAGSTDPSGNVMATGASPVYGTTPNDAMNANMIGLTGNSQGHENMEPYLVINFCIAIQGLFPPRN